MLIEKKKSFLNENGYISHASGAFKKLLRIHSDNIFFSSVHTFSNIFHIRVDPKIAVSLAYLSDQWK